jgi:hypothetical protein
LLASPADGAGPEADRRDGLKFRTNEESSMYDAIVVGARCAGSPTAMLLARKGYPVLLVHRARFLSDTVSIH